MTIDIQLASDLQSLINKEIKSKKYTIEDVAEKSGLTSAAIAWIFRQENLSLHTAIMLTEALDIPVNIIVRRKKKKNV